MTGAFMAFAAMYDSSLPALILGRDNYGIPQWDQTRAAIWGACGSKCFHSYSGPRGLFTVREWGIKRTGDSPCICWVTISAPCCVCVCVCENIYMCFVCVCPSLMEQLLLGPWVCPRTWPAALTPNSPLNLRSPYTQIHMQSLHTHTFTWYASPSQCNQGNVMCLPLWGMRVWLRSSHLAEERRGEERRGEERRGSYFNEQSQAFHCDHYTHADRPALPSISRLAAQPLGQTPSDIKPTINTHNTCPASSSHRHKPPLCKGWHYHIIGVERHRTSFPPICS